MRHYHVTFVVSAAKLPTLLQAVAPEVALIGVTEAPQSSPDVQKTRQGGYVGGKKNKGISAEDLILQTLMSEPRRTWTSTEMTQVFVSHSFAGHSFHAAASKLVAEKKIRRIAPGLFAPLGLIVTKTA